MANKIQGNTIYIDTTANDVDTDAIAVHYVLYTATSAAGDVLFLDSSGGNEIARFEAATANDTKVADFSRRPLVLSKGLHVTVSNCKATLIYSKVGKA